MKKKTKRWTEFSIIGTYLDTPTNTSVGVVYFLGQLGEFRLSTNDIKGVIVQGCQFNVKLSELKRKKKFHSNLKPYLEAEARRELHLPDVFPNPRLFGLLKLRKKKERKFLLIYGANSYFNSKVVTIQAVVLDNLTYLDLANNLRTGSLQTK